MLKLKDSADQNLINDAAHVLLDQAKLFDGKELDDTADFIFSSKKYKQKKFEVIRYGGRTD